MKDMALKPSKVVFGQQQAGKYVAAKSEETELQLGGVEVWQKKNYQELSRTEKVMSWMAMDDNLSVQTPRAASKNGI